MTTATGKSGRYRYYKCSNLIRKGSTKCSGRTVPMEEMDELIIGAIKLELLSTSKVGELLAQLLKRQSQSSKDRKEQISSREAALQAAQQTLSNLYSLVSEGLVKASDGDFKDRFMNAKQACAVARKERDQVMAELAPEAKADHEAIARFVSDMTNALELPSVAAKRSYLRSIIDGIEVGEKSIIIYGQKKLIERAVLNGTIAPSGVPTFVREWRRE